MNRLDYGIFNQVWNRDAFVDAQTTRFHVEVLPERVNVCADLFTSSLVILHHTIPEFLQDGILAGKDCEEGVYEELIQIVFKDLLLGKCDVSVFW